ncbi:hypothetical protein BB559_003681 [Furculomyces boomerangus]|uniref:Histone-lysine N-methyltransferase, H3 lysine-4 specific n=1 Tax=Furculomyces boomerangus TaxID=61424 RepID=A0A2T9YJM2_9FUNG|nr:hypothetical protein BB559_003681 [Furculomyces boomerangus]
MNKPKENGHSSKNPKPHSHYSSSQNQLTTDPEPLKTHKEHSSFLPNPTNINSHTTLKKSSLPRHSNKNPDISPVNLIHSDPRRSSTYSNFRKKAENTKILNSVAFEYDKHSVQKSPNFSIVVYNLSPLITSEHLEEFFNDFGNVSKINIARDLSTGMSLGIVLIEFSNSRDTLIHPRISAKNVLTNQPLLKSEFGNVKISTNQLGLYEALVKKAHLQAQRDSFPRKELPNSPKNDSIIFGKPNSVRITTSTNLKITTNCDSIKIDQQTHESTIPSHLKKCIDKLNPLHILPYENCWYVVLDSEKSVNRAISEIEHLKLDISKYVISPLKSSNDPVIKDLIEKKLNILNSNIKPETKLNNNHPEETAKKTHEMLISRLNKNFVTKNSRKKIIDSLANSFLLDLKKRLLGKVIFEKIKDSNASIAPNLTSLANSSKNIPHVGHLNKDTDIFSAVKTISNFKRVLNSSELHPIEKNNLPTNYSSLPSFKRSVKPQKDKDQSITSDNDSKSSTYRKKSELSNSKDNKPLDKIDKKEYRNHGIKQETSDDDESNDLRNGSSLKKNKIINKIDETGLNYKENSGSYSNLRKNSRLKYPDEMENKPNKKQKIEIKTEDSYHNLDQDVKNPDTSSTLDFNNEIKSQVDIKEESQEERYPNFVLSFEETKDLNIKTDANTMNSSEFETEFGQESDSNSDFEYQDGKSKSRKSSRPPKRTQLLKSKQKNVQVKTKTNKNIPVSANFSDTKEPLDSNLLDVGNESSITDMKSPRELKPIDEKNTDIAVDFEDTFVHSTGSARTEGYYKIQKNDKSKYLLPLLPQLHWSANFFTSLKINTSMIDINTILGTFPNSNHTKNKGIIQAPKVTFDKSAQVPSTVGNYARVYGTGTPEYGKSTQTSTTTASGSMSRSQRAANRKLRVQLSQYKPSHDSETENIKSNSVHRQTSGEVPLGNENKMETLQLNALDSRTKSLFFAKSGIHDFGLFAKEKIYSGEFVIEYIGERIRSIIADLREKRYSKVKELSDCIYLFRIDTETVIDATFKGNISRFVNHSCSPNCIAKVIVVDGSKRIGIYAKADIEIGDEITYDYKFSYEDSDEKIPCLCGSATCRGFLN